jgi:hypothetical protein
MGKVAILLIGFNRTDLLINRINELKTVRLPIYISMDGNTSKYQRSENEEELIIRNSQSLSDSSIIFHKTNLGIANHLPMMLTKLFCQFDWVIIIEDDISIPAINLASLINQIQETASDELIILGLFSFIGGSYFKFLPNFWRTSRYFNGWGWATNRNTWSKYVGKLTEKDAAENLMNCKKWKELSRAKRNFWKLKFEKISKFPNLSWDYQVQYMIFLHGITVKRPIFRASENLGFFDSRGTNLKGPKPKWYIGSVTENVIKNEIKSKNLINLLNFFDSNTWIMDGKYIKLLASILKKTKLSH